MPVFVDGQYVLKLSQWEIEFVGHGKLLEAQEISVFVAQIDNIYQD